MGVVGILVVLTIAAAAGEWLRRLYARNHKRMSGIPSLSTWPLVGNVHQLRHKPDGQFGYKQAAARVLKNNFLTAEFFEMAQGIAYMFGRTAQRIVCVWIGPQVSSAMRDRIQYRERIFQPLIMVYGASECEAILSSQKTLTKLFHYDFLSPWIGDGLLIR